MSDPSSQSPKDLSEGLADFLGNQAEVSAPLLPGNQPKKKKPAGFKRTSFSIYSETRRELHRIEDYLRQRELYDGDNQMLIELAIHCAFKDVTDEELVELWQQILSKDGRRNQGTKGG